ncbi:hypothetical protein NECAME_14379 [Necator americanus]|uniref:Uncharacterized protein n=1 Tax=Necator americanus TaxID=51031 RepID=W2SQT5_NECAM|nr:hypothetical protein NECAME_14379 [Necator americanus]ETN71057.1 hypothetical protein NECAME_14379 [Necator americanus]
MWTFKAVLVISWMCTTVYSESKKRCRPKDYKPWFHADRWVMDKPYVLIRKSKKYAGMKKEMYRPDATSYIQPIAPVPLIRQPTFQKAQLMWPFDPESITIPLWARDKYRLTQYCPARNDVDIGAGQRVGLLTKWDTIKLNTMYCPERVNADPQRGPCVVPRAKDAEEFKRRGENPQRLSGLLID